MIQPEQPENGLSKTVVHHLSAGMILEGSTWKTMQVFYDRLVNDGLPYEPLLDLVKAITAFPYASLLHGTPSHTGLLVFGYSPFEVNGEKRVSLSGEAVSVYLSRTSPEKSARLEKDLLC